MSEEIVAAVTELSIRSGHQFTVSSKPVTGTDLYVVYATNHPLPASYTVQTGVLGFRVPSMFPDAHPEDAFFIQPHDVKLKAVDQVRKNSDIHRASVSPDLLKGTELAGQSVLVFSWHLWDRAAWDRTKHTLVDHYQHCIRRFEQPEHD